jgi:hypothetical protein
MFVPPYDFVSLYHKHFSGTSSRAARSSACAKDPIDDLALPDDFSALELCYRGLYKLPGPDAKRHRIDILCVPWENRRSLPLLHGK